MDIPPCSQTVVFSREGVSRAIIAGDRRRSFETAVVPETTEETRVYYERKKASSRVNELSQTEPLIDPNHAYGFLARYNTQTREITYTPTIHYATQVRVHKYKPGRSKNKRGYDSEPEVCEKTYPKTLRVTLKRKKETGLLGWTRIHVEEDLTCKPKKWPRAYKVKKASV